MAKSAAHAASSIAALLSVAAFSLLALVLVGCGPHWVVVRQAAPRARSAPTSKVYIDRVSLEGLIVGEKTESQWMSEKGNDTRDSWDGDKSAMNEKFIAAFADSAHDVPLGPNPEGSFTVRAHFYHYEPGFYTYIVNRPATIDADLFILDAAGNVVDQIKLSGAANGISAGERARACASRIGWAAGKYVRQRFGL